MEEIARPVLESIGLDVDLHAILGELAISDQQLIELARVIIEKPKLLILDEPTASVDDISEEAITEALIREAAGGRIILVASHRPTTIATADNTIRVNAR